jgi:ADP-heptose:LPS heptosyltransferase
MSSKLYWNTPRIQNVSINNIYKIYNEFIKQVIGEEDENLKILCLDICNKRETNPNYYGQIITLINLLGLQQYKKESNKYIVEKNDFLFDNMDNIKFIEKYLDYSLAYFQYPRHNISEDRTLKIRKPYIVVLMLLKKLAERDSKESYLTKNEFYYLFNKIDKSYEDIDSNLVDLILKNNREYGKSKEDVNMQWISYDMALFKNSSILTFDSSDYGDVDNFAFGLSNEYNVEAKLDRLLSNEVRNDIFEFKASLNRSDKDTITRWAKFLNNKERFEKWENQVFYEKDKEEVGESGFESGIESDEIEDEFITPFNPDDISINSQTVALDTVLRRIKQNRIRLAPSFQRNSVWDDTRKSRLIESMMLKIPLPMFYVSSDKDNNWDVVDGLQRITTIKEFVLGNYNSDKEKYDEKGFKLKNLEFWRKLNGQTYDDIPGKLYNNIAETELSFTVINPDTPEEVKRNIFKRINTGGMPLTAQEIRHALYQGLSSKLLKELAEQEAFLNAIDKVDDSRMGARELILRYLSFYTRDCISYAKDSNMDAYLSDTMRIINTFDEFSLETIQSEFKYEKKLDFNTLYKSIKFKELTQITKDFEIAMIRARKIFGEHTFRKSYPGKRRTPINKTLFEVFGNLLGALSEEEYQYLKKNKQQFLEEYKEEFLLKTEFAYMIGRDSHKVASVKKRYKDLSELINKYI